MPKSFVKSFACLGCVGALSLGVAAVCVVALLGYFGVNLLKAEAEHFNENRAAILAELETDLAAGRFDKVIDAGNTYIFVDDAELDRLVSEAKRARDNLAAADREREIQAADANAFAATVEKSGWIRNRCDVFEAPSTSSAIAGYLTSRASVDVADDGSGWLRLRYGPILDSSSKEFLDDPDFDSGLYIESRFFTTELPANWR